MPVPETLIGIFYQAARRNLPDQFMRKTSRGWEAISAEKTWNPWDWRWPSSG